MEFLSCMVTCKLYCNDLTIRYNSTSPVSFNNNIYLFSDTLNTFMDMVINGVWNICFYFMHTVPIWNVVVGCVFLLLLFL